MYAYTVGGASTLAPEMFWSENGLLSADTSIRQKGNLYIVADGPQGDSELAIKTIRNQYYGGLGQSQDVTGASLRESIESANLLLSRRTGSGVSCVCATVSQWGQYSLFMVGDCQALIFSGRNDEVYELDERQNVDGALGRSAELELSEVKGMLKDKDTLILCSGVLADSLSLEEIASIASVQPIDGPQEIAASLVESAFLEGTGGISTALVVACQRTRFGVDPTLSLNLRTRTQLAISGLRWKLGHAGAQVRFKLSQLPFGVPKLLGFDPMPMIAVALAILFTVVLMVRALEPSFSSEPTPVLPSPTVPSTPAVTMVAVDELWKKGEAGDVSAWQEAVSLLKQLQALTPEDQLVGEKLSAAQENLTYAERMQEVAAYWGRGETSAATTGSWSRAVETLEAMMALPLSPGQASDTKRKLYAAHVNYGKALEAAKRVSEAKGQYERATEIDPKGVEAIGSLKRLSK